MRHHDNKIIKSVIRLVVLFLIINAFIPSQALLESKTQSVPFPGSCTTFFASIGNTSLFGNNEDYNNPNTMIWVVPSSEDSYGGIYLGYKEGRPQGGINEKGLAFDGLATPPYPMNEHPELPDVSIYSTYLWKEIMAKSANIDEAIDIAMQYNWADPTPHQVLFADRNGNAAVIGPGMDGEISVTRKSPGDGFLLATNFNLADPTITVTGWRYDTAAVMLAKIQKEEELTTHTFQHILDSVHVEGDANNTLYSNIFDLNTGIVYLYYWHQFGEAVTLNVEEEIASATPTRRIQDLFSEKTIRKAKTEYRRYLGEIPYAEEYYVVGWFAIAGVCLLFFFQDVFSKKATGTRSNLFWALIIIFSGVIGFMVYWYYRKPRTLSKRNLPQWQRACGAAIFSATGYGASFLIMLLAFHFFFPEGSSGITSLLIPFIISLLLFRAPLLASITSEKYYSLIVRCILTELISTIFALASVIFIDSLIKTAYPMAAAPDNIMFFGMISAYTIASFITILPFHFWLAHNGYTLWFEIIEPTGNLPRSVGKIKVLSFKKGWFFLPISIALLALVIKSV